MWLSQGRKSKSKRRCIVDEEEEIRLKERSLDPETISDEVVDIPLILLNVTVVHFNLSTNVYIYDHYPSGFKDFYLFSLFKKGIFWITNPDSFLYLSCR